MRIWLACIGFLVAAMIIVGGATRLTDSGLSITEWQLIAGFIPPLNEFQWLEAFEKYKQIPEFAIINPDMTLSGFKFIYWWEWAHRFLGRFVGIVFVVPYLTFLLKGLIGPALNRRLIFILALGGLQGALGWYMVSSGLVDRVDVSQYRLAAHLGLAFLILAVISWTFMSLSSIAASAPDRAGCRGAAALTVLVGVQIILGAFVAGTDAGLSHNSWPLMDGKLVPGDLFVMNPWWLNLFENVRTIQFHHRVVAYVLLITAIWHTARLLRTKSKAVNTSLPLAGIILFQGVIGVWTLILVVPLGLGLLHQMIAILVLLAAMKHLHGFFGYRESARFQTANLSA